MIKLEYQRQPPPIQRPKAPEKYPPWLGYMSAYISVAYALGYLSMVFFYVRGPDTRSAPSEQAAALVAVIACFYVVWSVYLFYIGTLIALGEPTSEERVRVWCAVQLAVAVLLVPACAYERYCDGTNTALATERSTAIAFQVGIASTAYAVFLLCMRMCRKRATTDVDGTVIARRRRLQLGKILRYR